MSKKESNPPPPLRSLRPPPPPGPPDNTVELVVRKNKFIKMLVLEIQELKAEAIEREKRIRELENAINTGKAANKYPEERNYDIL